ncbi:hypothetical protein [Endozoicomonas ascidiicola]|uniref:hypothetical protein n=1 Tax=Endozoicomonas ascidiicola TaxID=1698521 RepID=UPI00082E398F|nr:hypothetical protein [Endozoicomonas ascidiicola]
MTAGATVSRKEPFVLQEGVFTHSNQGKHNIYAVKQCPDPALIVGFAHCSEETKECIEVERTELVDRWIQPLNSESSSNRPDSCVGARLMFQGVPNKSKTGLVFVLNREEAEPCLQLWRPKEKSYSKSIYIDLPFLRLEGTTVFIHKEKLKGAQPVFALNNHHQDSCNILSVLSELSLVEVIGTVRGKIRTFPLCQLVSNTVMTICVSKEALRKSEAQPDRENSETKNEWLKLLKPVKNGRSQVG